MANVKIVSKKNHEILVEGQKDSLTLLEPSVVLLQVDIKDVNRIEKDGRNVKVTLKVFWFVLLVALMVPTALMV